MTEETQSPVPEKPDRTGAAPGTAPSRGGRLALLVAVLALAASAAQWLGITGDKFREPARNEDLAKLQRRLNSLDDRLQRERKELDRLGERIGTDIQAEESLSGRVAGLESTLAKRPGGENARQLWLAEQAEYYMRIANAQLGLAGNVAGALTALELADEHLRDAADPRLLGVRKLLAAEMKALRAVPRVDTEGMILKLVSLSAALDALPRIRTAPAQFNPQPAAPAEDATGLDRAGQVLRNAFLSVISVRRTDGPTATLLTEESETLLARSLELELQMARLALLRGDNHAFTVSVAAVRSAVETYFDTSTPAGADALTALDEIAGVQMPGTLPDISASLAELLQVKERVKERGNNS